MGRTVPGCGVSTSKQKKGAETADELRALSRVQVGACLRVLLFYHTPRADNLRRVFPALYFDHHFIAVCRAHSLPCGAHVAREGLRGLFKLSFRLRDCGAVRGRCRGFRGECGGRAKNDPSAELCRVLLQVFRNPCSFHVMPFRVAPELPAIRN